MALLFNYSLGNITATGQLPAGFAGIVGSPTFGSADGPQGINTIHCTGTPGGFALVPNVAIPINAYGLIVGAGFNVSGGFSGPTSIFTIGGLGNVGSALFCTLSPDGSIQIFLSGSPPVSSPSGVFSFGTRHEVEIKVSAFSSSGQVSVELDGAAIPSLTNVAVGALQSLPDGATIHTVCVGGSDGGTVATSAQVIDSVYACDTQGSFFNSFQGPCISVPMIPNGVGHVSSWTPNGAALGWECIDDIPPDNDTTYISSSTVAQEEACTLSAPAHLTAVYGVTVFADMRQDTAGGGRTVSVGLGNGSTQDYGSPYGTWGLSTTYAMTATPFSNNPFTGIAWALADMSTLQVAAKVAT